MDGSKSHQDGDCVGKCCLRCDHLSRHQIPESLLGAGIAFKKYFDFRQPKSDSCSCFRNLRKLLWRWMIYGIERLQFRCTPRLCPSGGAFRSPATRTHPANFSFARIPRRCKPIGSIFEPPKPAWRNWQTRWTQNPVFARMCRFDPDRRYSFFRSQEAHMENPAFSPNHV